MRTKESLDGKGIKEVSREAGDIISKLLEPQEDKHARMHAEAEILRRKKCKMFNVLGYETLESYEAHGCPFNTGFFTCIINCHPVELGLKGTFALQTVNIAESYASFVIESIIKKENWGYIYEIFSFTTKPEIPTSTRNGFAGLNGEMSVGEFEAATELITLIGKARKEKLLMLILSGHINLPI